MSDPGEPNHGGGEAGEPGAEEPRQIGSIGGGRGGGAVERRDSALDIRRELEAELQAIQRERLNQALEDAVAEERLRAEERVRREGSEPELKPVAPMKEAPSSEPARKREGRDDLVGGEPYTESQYVGAGKLYADRKMTVAGVMRFDLSKRRAYRVYRQYKNHAVVYENGKLLTDPKHEWDRGLLGQDPPLYRLLSV